MTDAERYHRKAKTGVVERVAHLDADAIRSAVKQELALLRRLTESAGPVPGMGLEKAPDRLDRSWSERNFKTVFETSRDAIMLLTDNGFFDCNPSTLALFGIDTIDEFIRMHPSDLSPPIQPCGRPSFEVSNEHIGRAMQCGSARFEWMHRRSNGEDFEADVLLSCLEDSGRKIVQATVRDISEMKRMRRELEASNDELACALAELETKNQTLERLAMTDQLTGLFNRRKLDEVMRSHQQSALQGGQQMAIIIADLDHFKRINDTYGHQRGDAILREIADIMEREARRCGLIGRWGGEEFMVICSGASAAEAALVADRMRLQIRRNTFADGSSFTCSFGVADLDGAGGVDALIRRADDALYEAKAAGRDRVFVSRRSDEFPFDALCVQHQSS